jgi:hypothetical protein
VARRHGRVGAADRGASHLRPARRRSGQPRGPDRLALRPVTGASILRQLIRVRIIAAREAGLEEKQDALLAEGREQGLELAGYRLGPAMIAGLESATAPTEDISTIGQDLVGGPPSGCAPSRARTPSRPMRWPPSSPSPCASVTP